MTWLTWRQLRTQAAVVYAAVAAAAALLVLTRPVLLAHTRVDTSVFDGLTRTDHNLFLAGVVGLAVLPAVIGAFWGAPMVAREVESGTHRLVWNQSVTRTRWLATKLGLTAAAAAACVGALTLAVTWWSDPVDGATSTTRGALPARLTPVTFAMRGVVPIAYAVFALVLGVAVGCVLRRTLPAMAITLALFTVVQIAVPLWIRPHLVAPTTQTLTIDWDTLDGIRGDATGRPVSLTVASQDPDDWVLSNQTLDGAGHLTGLPSWLGQCLPGPPSGPTSAPDEPVSRASLDTCFARFAAEGYRQRIVYQPADHFWPLQWAEAGLFLAMSGGLAGFCFWWTRRRLV